jgi:predicted phosphate transport protein (TIGR00153 family)
MNLDSVLKYFVPKDTSFYPLFDEDAKILIRASELLKTLMQTNNIEDREVIIRQIKAVEHDGDEITHKIFQQLNKSFITPFDREDIQELASCLDDVVDFINGTGQRIHLYKPKIYMPVFLDMTDIIYQCAKEIEISIHALKNSVRNKEKIIQACINLNTFENKADELHHLGLSELFEKETDTVELIKKKEILETLEKTVDKAEDVADAVKTILVKMA